MVFNVILNFFLKRFTYYNRTIRIVLEIIAKEVLEKK